jgi:hypothetical protein
MSDDLLRHGISIGRLVPDPNSASGYKLEYIPVSEFYLDPRDARIAQLERDLAQAQKERDEAHNAAIELVERICIKEIERCVVSINSVGLLHRDASRHAFAVEINTALLALKRP